MPSNEGTCSSATSLCKTVISADRNISPIATSLPINCLLSALAREERDPVATLGPVIAAFKRKDALPESLLRFLLEGIWSAYVYRWGNNDNVSNKIKRTKKRKLGRGGDRKSGT